VQLSATQDNLEGATLSLGGGKGGVPTPKKFFIRIF